MNIEVFSVKFVASFQEFTIFADHIDMKTFEKNNNQCT